MPKQRTTSKPRVVITSAYHDKPTKATGDYLESKVNAFNEYDVICLKGEDDTAANYRNAITDNTVLHLGTGHGDSDTYYGVNKEIILNQYTDSKYVENMVHYLIACNTAEKLGKVLINKGAKAFIGWDDTFKVVGSGESPLEDPVMKSVISPALEGVDVLVSGGTVKEAYDRIKRVYEKEYGKWRNKSPLVAGAIAWNLKHLALLGDRDARIKEVAPPPSDDQPDNQQNHDHGQSHYIGYLLDMNMETSTIQVEMEIDIFGFTARLILDIDLNEQRVTGRLEPVEKYPN